MTVNDTRTTGTLTVRRVLWAVAAYFLLQLLVRFMLPNGLHLDEAEQFIWTQSLMPGYGPELPLYTWIQAGFFALFGTNKFALSLLKNGLLFCMYFCTFLGAREATRDERCGLAALLLVFCIPQIVWESQRALTHMILATALVAATLFFFLRIHRDGRLRYYLAFALLSGLGLLTKYNFSIYLLALLAAGLSVSSMRSRILDRKMLLALLLTAAVVYFPISWILEHKELAFAKSKKLRAGQGAGLVRIYLAGLGKLGSSVIAFVSVPLALTVILGALSPKTSAATTHRDDAPVLVRNLFVFILLICLVMVLVFKVTYFKVRWMQPLLFPVPILLVAYLKDRMNDRMLKRLAVLATIAASTVLVFTPARILLASVLGPTPLNEPYAALTKELRQQGFDRGVIAVDGQYLAGNMKLFFPASTVVTPEFPTGVTPEPLSAAPWLVVWDADASPAMPEPLAAYLASFSGIAPGADFRYLEAPYTFAETSKRRLGYLILPRRGADSGRP